MTLPLPPEQLTEHEVKELVERLRERPEVRVAQLEVRIAKAKAILEVTALDSESSWARIKAKEALAALEGK